MALILIEVLVVLTILGILAALLLPTLSLAKARAKRIQCVSNVCQLGVGLHEFVSDSPPDRRHREQFRAALKPV